MALALVIAVPACTPGPFGPPPLPPPAPPAEPPPSGSLPLLRLGVYGDSVTWTWGFAAIPEVLTPLAVTYDNRAQWFCELLTGTWRIEFGRPAAPHTACDGWRESWRADVAARRPDVVLFGVGAWEVFDRIINGRIYGFGTPAFDAILEPALDDALAALGSSGARVAVVTTPYLERPVDDPETSKEWTASERWRVDHLNDLLRRAAGRREGTEVLDLHRFMCPTADGPCRPPSGSVLRPDGVHFDQAGAAEALGWMVAELRRRGDARWPAAEPLI